jgi:DNA-binding GntR family transcriptional regulator
MPGDRAGAGREPAVTALRATERVAREVRAGLREGRYAPGQRLSEPDLMRRTGVSRSSVREALVQLAGEGLLTLAPNKGATIRHLTRSEAQGIQLVAGRLGELAADLAAQRVRAGDPGVLAPLQEMRALADALGAQTPVDFDAAQSDMRQTFYARLMQASGNSEIVRIATSLNTILLTLHTRRWPDRLRQGAFLGYRLIVAAIEAGHPAAAVEQMREFVRARTELLAELPQDIFAPDNAPTAWRPR